MAKSAIPDAQRLNAFLVEPERLVVVDDPKHPLFDERVKLPIDEKMVLNIMAYGVRQAINVRKNGDRLEVVDGRQRVRHAIEANKRLAKEGKEPVRVRVHVERGTDADLFGASIFLNEYRRNDDPLTKSKKAQRLLDLGKSEDEVAVIFGVTTAAVRQWLKLGDLAPKVQKAVEAGEIAPSAAAKLAELPREEQVAELDKLQASGEKVTTKKVAVAAKKAKGKEVADLPSPARVRKVVKLALDADADGVDCRQILRWIVGEIGERAAGVERLLITSEPAEAKAAG